MNTWRLVHSLGVAGLIVAIAAIGYFVTTESIAWVLTMVLMLAMLVIVGLGVAGRPAGAWIDERNKMTLSRLQLIAWTVVVLSGFLVAVLHNLRVGTDDALAVAVPEVLWLAMGISTISLVGSPLILSTKKVKPPNVPETNRMLTNLDGARAESTGDPLILKQEGANVVRAIGTVEVRASAADASWADLFRGDETGNAAYVDLTKVQMLLLTVVVLLAYGLAVYSLLSGEGPLTALPALDEGMVALLGISHAGYLSGKAVNHSAPAAP